VIAELMEENVRSKKSAGELLKDVGFPTTPAIKSSTSYSTGPNALTYLPKGCSIGWGFPPASSTSGKIAMGSPTNTMVRSLATGGWRIGKSGRFSITMTAIHWKVTEAWPS
jgi:hypothetical protein